ncbi:MAG TPA: hypothetical protein VFO24_00390, partial [Usitatibacter sp.]|nr:hypothetical protein [Usitatibacter sp.]
MARKCAAFIRNAKLPCVGVRQIACAQFSASEGVPLRGSQLPRSRDVRFAPLLRRKPPALRRLALTRRYGKRPSGIVDLLL